MQEKKRIINSIFEDANLHRELQDRLKTSIISSNTNLSSEELFRFVEICEREGFDAARQKLGSSRANESEAVIMRLGRPSLLVANGSFELPESGVWQSRLSIYKDNIQQVIPSVGRVELRNHPSFKYVGTAWLIADDIIVTNAHVAEEFGEKSGNSFAFKVKRGKTIGATIDFQEEYGLPGERQFRVTKILNIGDIRAGEPDLAFLQINQTGLDHNGNFITLTTSPLELKQNFSEGETIVAIGYPAFDSRASEHGATNVVNNIFDFKYNHKRLAPGEVVSKSSLEFTHDCSTLRGNSGSPIIDIETGKVIGIHYEGVFWEENYAISSTTVADYFSRII